LFSHDLLAGRRIVVTGASSGIGRAAAEQFACLGAHICLLARRKHLLEDVRLSLVEPDRHLACEFDLSKTDEIADRMKDIAATFGPISGLFHAAGVESLTPLKVTKDQQVLALLQSSVVAAVMLIKAVTSMRVMDQSQPAAIVLMSSVAAVRGHPSLAAYSAAKAGCEGAMRSLAVELAPKGIRVNAIASSAVETPMHERTLKGMNEQMLSSYLQRHPLGFGRPEDVAHAATFLISPLSRWITGTTLNVDGGYLCL